MAPVGMCITNTPVTHHPEFGLYVKHEEKCCPGGPNFSKTRGVYAHALSRSESLIGVLDTSHSQGGWAVARACKTLGKRCVEFYPVRKATPDWLGPVQVECQRLGAETISLPAGRSAVLYHRARAELARLGSARKGEPVSVYMFPNALKLAETVAETAAEVGRTELPPVKTILVSASSGTIAAGVGLGLLNRGWKGRLLVHLGYDRPHDALRKYMTNMIGWFPWGKSLELVIVSEGYQYADAARSGPTPPFACNEFYDLKAFRYWAARYALGAERDPALMWNVG